MRAASRNGTLVKGSNYLDALKDVETVIFDKTGTLTQGDFAVRNIHWVNSNGEEILPLVLAAEQNSTHPIAKVIFKYSNVQTQRSEERRVGKAGRELRYRYA